MADLYIQMKSKVWFIPCFWVQFGNDLVIIQQVLQALTQFNIGIEPVGQNENHKDLRKKKDKQVDLIQGHLSTIVPMFMQVLSAASRYDGSGCATLIKSAYKKDFININSIFGLEIS